MLSKTFLKFRAQKNLSQRFFASKIFANAEEATKDIKDGSTICAGGFGLCGIPETLIGAIAKHG